MMYIADLLHNIDSLRNFTWLYQAFYSASFCTWSINFAETFVLVLMLKPFQVLEEVLQVFELSARACSMSELTPVGVSFVI